MHRWNVSLLRHQFANYLGQQPSSRCMYSLQGLAGAVCFWLDALDPEHAAFPGYEL